MNTQLRIGHFSPDAPAVNIFVDDELLFENVSFGTIGEFMDIEMGSYDLKIVPASGDDAVIETTLDLDAEMSYTVLAINTLAELETLVLTDEQPSIDAGDARLRFVHTVPDAPAVDIFVGGAPLFENVAFGDISPFATVEARAYDIDVRPVGSSDPVLSLSDLRFDDATSFTIFATGMLEENTLDAMLVSDFVSTDMDDRKVATR